MKLFLVPFILIGSSIILLLYFGVVIMWIILWLLGYCYQCKRFFKYPKRYDRGTAYSDKLSNFSEGCKECAQEDIDRVQDDWDDYYRGQGHFIPSRKRRLK